MERGLQKANHYNQLAEWAQRVEACRKSGRKVSEWCIEQGIPVSTYYSWQRKVYETVTAEPEVCFTEISARAAGRLELSNNRAERTIKPFVIDRKNFLFANTPSGAKSSAVIFSLIQTAAENGLDPYRCLSWLLSSAAELNLVEPNVVQSLLPWNAPAACKA